MTKNDPAPSEPNDAILSVFFEAERIQSAHVSEQLTGRVMRDAFAMQKRPAASRVTSNAIAWKTWLGDTWRAFGGLPAAAVLGLFCIAGVTLGVTPPDGLARLSDEVLNAAGLARPLSADTTLDDLVSEG